MSAQHTPGPWEVVEVPHTGLIGVRRGNVVLNLDAKFEADAQLIAAAPDLIDAARRLERRGFFAPSACADDETAADMVLMRAAIAKATGRA